MNSEISNAIDMNERDLEKFSKTELIKMVEKLQKKVKKPQIVTRGGSRLSYLSSMTQSDLICLLLFDTFIIYVNLLLYVLCAPCSFKCTLTIRNLLLRSPAA